MGSGLDLEIKGLKEALALLDKYDRKELLKRFRNGVSTAIKPMASSMRSEAPRGDPALDPRSGETRGQVRIVRLRGGGAVVGPLSRRNQTRAQKDKIASVIIGRRQGRRGVTRGNHFVDRAIDREVGGVVKRVRDAILAVHK